MQRYEWCTLHDKASGRPFFFNEKERVSSYTLPRGVPARKVQKGQPDDEPKGKGGLKARFHKVLPTLFDKVRAIWHRSSRS